MSTILHNAKALPNIQLIMRETIIIPDNTSHMF